MKNEEKYKTVKERSEAFDAFCSAYKNCNNCPLPGPPVKCEYAWLALKAEEEEEEEEPLLCPCCSGSSMLYVDTISGRGQVKCTICGLCTPLEHSPTDALAKWNRRPK